MCCGHRHGGQRFGERSRERVRVRKQSSADCQPGSPRQEPFLVSAKAAMTPPLVWCACSAFVGPTRRRGGSVLSWASALIPVGEDPLLHSCLHLRGDTPGGDTCIFPCVSKTASSPQSTTPDPASRSSTTCVLRCQAVALGCNCMEKGPKDTQHCQFV